MATLVSIYNLALNRCGISQLVTAVDEGSTGADQCTAVYDLARDETLRAAPWEFAAARLALALVEEDPNDDWGYSYAWPSDCITARIIPGGARGTSQPFVRGFQPVVGLVPAKRLIFTDVEDAELIYTAQVTDPTLYDADFVSALAWRIAADVSMALSVAPGFRDGALRAYDAAIATAKANMANEQKRDPDEDSMFITERL